MDNDRSHGLPLFLAGLGAGIGLTLLFASRNGAATRRVIGRKVKEGEDWMKDKAAAAEDYVLTCGAELRDRVKDAAEGIGRS
jgi:hypothetical protein